MGVNRLMWWQWLNLSIISDTGLSQSKSHVRVCWWWRNTMFSKSLSIEQSVIAISTLMAIFQITWVGQFPPPPWFYNNPEVKRSKVKVTGSAWVCMSIWLLMFSRLFCIAVYFCWYGSLQLLTFSRSTSVSSLVQLLFTYRPHDSEHWGMSVVTMRTFRLLCGYALLTLSKYIDRISNTSIDRVQLLALFKGCS